MNGDEKRRYTIGGSILAVFTALTVFNNVAVTRATDDQWCSHTLEGECIDHPTNKCSATVGWSCKHTKSLGDPPANCGCSENDPE